MTQRQETDIEKEHGHVECFFCPQTGLYYWYVLDSIHHLRKETKDKVDECNS